MFESARASLVRMSKIWKIAGINFDHMHMGDLLRHVHEHPCAEIVGICDEVPDRMRSAAKLNRLRFGAVGIGASVAEHSFSH